MIAFCDVCESKPTILKDSGGNWFKQVVSKVDTVNGNKRVYPREVYDDAVTVLKKEQFPYAGEHPHPDSYIGADGCVYFNGSVTKSAVKFRDAYIDDSGSVWAEYTTLDTEMGRQVRSLIDAGVAIGFSNRMTGAIEKQIIDGALVDVATELNIITWDVVMNPAEKVAFGVPVLIDGANEENIKERLNGLGYMEKPVEKAIIITKERTGNMALIDNLMECMDRERAKKRIVADKELRKANSAILDGVFRQFESSNPAVFKDFMRALSDEEGLSSPSASTTGEFAQSASVSLAILKQTFNDLNFLQLCLVEGFTGPTYKMPVEFQSGDIYNEDIFSVGELEGIPTESVQTFMLEFGCEWLKRGFVVSKEAEKQLLSGQSGYDVIAANAASIAGRFARIIDGKISAEMISRADEYGCVRVAAEIPDNKTTVIPGSNAPNDTNAGCFIRLSHELAPIVRPRLCQWLDTEGRLKKEYINDIIVEYDGDALKRGLWNQAKGKIVDIGGNKSDYAVDFENGTVYFSDGALDKSKLKIDYSYATNVAYFKLDPPAGIDESKYYNKLLELVDVERAYMGSAPRYSPPDFLLGSLKAMVPFRQAELFYSSALPVGTEMLGGDIYFGSRNGVILGAHNAPWAVGDQRLLLGKRNATRVGVGSEFSIEGPFQHRDAQMYTSAKEWIATQQIAINTPLVIDSGNVQYQPPFRTIKYI